jgi:cyclopropane-fatty-acyl-phospholipid synthase
MISISRATAGRSAVGLVSDYAETLRRWRANFCANISRLDGKRYNVRFRHMWTFYLALCEAMFDGCGFQVGQVIFRER